MSVFVLTPTLVLIIFSFGKISSLATNEVGSLKTEQNMIKDTKFVFWLLGVILFAFITGQRFYFGDTISYMDYFNDTNMTVSQCLSNFSFGNEWLFEFIQVFIKQYITTDARVYLEIISFITIVPQMYFLYNYSGDLKLAFYFFVTMGCWEHSMNGLRQYLASSLMLAGICLICKRKWYFYIPLSIIVAQIHTSAYIFIIVYFIANKPAWGKFTKFMLAGGLILLVTYPISGSLLNSLFIENTEYGAKYNTSEFSYSINIFRILVMWVPVVLSYINRNLIDKNNVHYNLVFNMSFLCGVCTSIGMLSAVYARLNLYFETFNTILLTWNLNILCKTQKYKWIKTAAIVLFLLYFLYQMLVTYNLKWYERYVFFCNDWTDASWI